MEKKINKKALIVSMIFALISCGLVFSYIKTLNKPVAKEEPKIKLLVASRDIMVGEQIKASDIKTMEVPQGAVPEGIINDRKSIESYYAREQIIMGEPFRTERLTEWENLTLSFSIPEGKRAISVYVDENAIFSNQLRVGDRVDIIGNYTIETEDGKTIEFSRIIVQNVNILAIGSSRVQKNASDAECESADDAQLPGTVTLLVSPGDAEKIAYTSTFADFSFALRGNEDENTVNAPGIILNDLIQGSRLDDYIVLPKEGEQ
ncbi:MAG: Flp pilus assembly protein CpaB [Clostridiaceae bacterium]|jgi:pilus assembly protein CpaB|nr:Flp pilus assembly protein CpaB [Clostridiaceae bacterium]